MEGEAAGKDNSGQSNKMFAAAQLTSHSH